MKERLRGPVSSLPSASRSWRRISATRSTAEGCFRRLGRAATGMRGLAMPDLAALSCASCRGRAEPRSGVAVLLVQAPQPFEDDHLGAGLDSWSSSPEMPGRARSCPRRRSASRRRPLLRRHSSSRACTMRPSWKCSSPLRPDALTLTLPLFRPWKRICIRSGSARSLREPATPVATLAELFLRGAACSRRSFPASTSPVVGFTT